MALKYNLPKFADYSFSKIIYQMDDISPKSDEYRYPTDQQGTLNITKENTPSLINIKALYHNISYFYILTQSLLIIINNDSDSVLANSIYNNDSMKELIRILMHSKLSSIRDDKFKDKITGIIDSHDELKLNKNLIDVKNATILYDENEVLNFIQDKNKIYLRTKGLISDK